MKLGWLQSYVMILIVKSYSETYDSSFTKIHKYCIIISFGKGTFYVFNFSLRITTIMTFKYCLCVCFKSRQNYWIHLAGVLQKHGLKPE